MSSDLEKDSNQQIDLIFNYSKKTIDDIVGKSNGNTKTLLKSGLYSGEKSQQEKQDSTNTSETLSSLKAVLIDEDSEDSDDDQDNFECENFFNQVD